MMRGSNTNNSLQELVSILKGMRDGNFDYDGRDPDSAQSEVIEDINELENIDVLTRDFKYKCKTKDREHLWLNTRYGYIYCLYCHNEIKYA